MAISPIASIPTAASIRPPTPTAPAAGLDSLNSSQSASGTGSAADLFTGSLSNAADAQRSSDQMIQQAATGELNDLTGVMSAMTEAQLATQLTVAVRNKAVESFNEVMRMQI